MNRLMSVANLCNKSQNLYLKGYSEEQIEELIQNGDIRGRRDPQTGVMMVEQFETIGFLPDRFESTHIFPIILYNE